MGRARASSVRPRIPRETEAPGCAQRGAGREVGDAHGAVDAEVAPFHSRLGRPPCSRMSGIPFARRVRGTVSPLVPHETRRVSFLGEN